MPTVHGVTTPESVDAPVVHEDLADLARQLLLRDTMTFASEADRTAFFASLGISPSKGMTSYLIDAARYEFHTGAAWRNLIPGRVGRVQRPTGISTTTTEVIVDTLTFTALAGCTYRVTYSGTCASTAVDDLLKIRFRWQAGGTLTTGGTEFHQNEFNIDRASRPIPFCFVDEVAPTAGQVTVGSTLVRALGTGTVTICPFIADAVLLVDNIGVTG